MLKEQSLIKTKEAMRKQEEDRKMNMTNAPAPRKDEIPKPEIQVTKEEPERKWYDFSIYLNDEELEVFKRFIKVNIFKVRKVEK